MTNQEARLIAEERVGRKLSEAEYDDVLAYTRHKVEVNGHGEDYVPLLLCDEIKNHCFREQINTISHEFIEIMKEIDRERVIESVRSVSELSVH